METDSISSVDHLEADLQILRKRLSDLSAGVSDQSLRIEAEVHSPLLQRLGKAFELSESQLIFLVCIVGPSLDESFDVLLAKVSSDGASDITPELLKKIYGDSDELRDFCFKANPLIECGLLFYDPIPTYYHSILKRPLRVNERLIAYFYGDLILPKDVRGLLEFVARDETGEVAEESGKAYLEARAQLTEYLERISDSTLLYFHGPQGTGKLNAAADLCSQIKAQLISLDISELPLESEARQRRLDLVARELRLFGAAVVVTNWHELDEATGINPTQLVRRLLAATSLVILTSEKPFTLSRQKHAVIEIPFAAAGFSARKSAWAAHLNGTADSGNLDLESIAGVYRLNGGQIQSIVSQGKLRQNALSGLTDLTQADIVAGCQQASSQNLAELATKVDGKGSWNSLVLPDTQKEQLRELCNHMKYRSQVYEEWGYLSRVAAPGLNALFTGPPGTGKTLAASILAAELGLELYKIDLSTIVSKYIGETEKNLSNIFAEAELANVILFFDEADSLFGKRTAVNDSHDRYANIQVGYLLQKMEEFSGVTILASNLIENIDDAFMRRLHFSVDFPFPSAVEREQIWRVSFPEEAPLDEDVDFTRLGKRVKVPGGNIRNIALHAAFHAAADDSAITMRHIARAAKREYEKEGRSLDS